MSNLSIILFNIRQKEIMEDTAQCTYEMAICDQNLAPYVEKRETYTTLRPTSQQVPSAEYEQLQSNRKPHQKLADIGSGCDPVSDLTMSELENADLKDMKVTLNITRKYLITMILLTLFLLIISLVAIALAIASYSRSIPATNDSISSLDRIQNELHQLSTMTESNVSNLLNQLMTTANYNLEITNNNFSSQLEIVSNSVYNLSHALNQLARETQNGMSQITNNINVLGSQVSHLASVTQNNITRVQNQVNNHLSSYAMIQSTVTDLQDDLSSIQSQFISNSRAEQIHNDIRQQINTTIQSRLRSPINLYQGCYDSETSCSLQPWLSSSQPLFCNTSQYSITRTVSYTCNS